jgi:hypothetical protein
VAGAFVAPQPAAHPPANTRQTKTAPARTSVRFFMENASGSEDDGRRGRAPAATSKGNQRPASGQEESTDYGIQKAPGFQ